MRMIRLTDAISVVEYVMQHRKGWRVDNLIERFPYGGSEESPVERLLEMFSNSILDGLINDVPFEELK